MPTVTNTDAGTAGKTIDFTESNQTVTGLKTYDRGASAPFAVVPGAAKVDNLDADKLDGQEGSYYSDPANLSSVVSIAKGGTGAATFAANRALLGPVSGADAAPTVRALVSADVATEQVYSSTGAQANVAPSAGALVVILCTGAAPEISGFTGGAAGRQLLLVCKGTSLKVTHQGAGSDAANRIICEATSGQIVGNAGAILLTYDVTNSRWMAALVATGTALSYTPTWTGAGSNPAIGNGTLAGEYTQRGTKVHFRIRVIAGGTTTYGSGVYSWALPITGVAADQEAFACRIVDSGTAIFPCIGVPTSTTVLGVYAVAGQVSEAVPMTWASTDHMTLSGEYEVP